MTQRKRKQSIVAAQRAWSAADPRRAGGGFVPTAWYHRRNPRCRRQVFTNEVGRYQGFSMSAGGGYVAVLHPDENAEWVHALMGDAQRMADEVTGIPGPMIRGELGAIDGEIRFVDG